MNLPKFTELQQQVVIRKLIEMDSHRTIAKWLQNTSPEFKPEDMDQQQYELAVIKRCKDYVSNKDRKWYQIIKDGREQFKKELVNWAILEMELAVNAVSRYSYLNEFNVGSVIGDSYRYNEV